MHVGLVCHECGDAVLVKIRSKPAILPEGCQAYCEYVVNVWIYCVSLLIYIRLFDRHILCISFDVNQKRHTTYPHIHNMYRLYIGDLRYTICVCQIDVCKSKETHSCECVDILCICE